jgi:hypothetical protein
VLCVSVVSVLGNLQVLPNRSPLLHDLNQESSPISLQCQAPGLSAADASLAWYKDDVRLQGDARYVQFVFYHR